MSEALHTHRTEYVAEAAGLGLFMISACAFGTLLGHPHSPGVRALPDSIVRRVLMGLSRLVEESPKPEPSPQT
jgi:aquaporin Z